ncbi:hypothetical protein BH09PSE4_BH09PSE4_01870 [soil metagenome]
MLSRRSLLSAVTLLALPFPVLAQESGFVVDWEGEPVDPKIAARLVQQIAMVRALPIDPEIIAFWSRQPIFLARPGISSREGPRGVFFTRGQFPSDNPELLHELCHRFQRFRLPDGFRNATVAAAFEAAVKAGHYPPQAYLYTNPSEFFAMTASCVLHGRTQRPPFSRAEVFRQMPEYHNWIVQLFGLRL